MSSLESIFLSRRNVEYLSGKIGRNASLDMKNWTKSHNLDDYESVTNNPNVTVSAINTEFIKKYKKHTTDTSYAMGQKYPKYQVSDNVSGYYVDDFRKHDAYFTQEVMISNSNFRYGNRIKKWESGLYKRNYDHTEHELGLGDIAERETLQRGYIMNDVRGHNKFES